MGSSIPGCRTALAALLTSLTGNLQPLDGVGIFRGDVYEPHGYRERVIVQNATDIERDYYLSAHQTRETYTVPVRVEVWMAGDDFQACEERMWTIMAVVEQAILNSGDLGGGVSSCAPFGIPSGEISEPYDDQSVYAKATVSVQVMAVVSLAG